MANSKITRKGRVSMLLFVRSTHHYMQLVHFLVKMSHFTILLKISKINSQTKNKMTLLVDIEKVTTDELKNIKYNGRFQ